MKYSEFKQQIQSIKNVKLKEHIDADGSMYVNLLCERPGFVNPIDYFISLKLNDPQLIYRTNYREAELLDLQDFITVLQCVARLQATPIKQRVDKSTTNSYYLIDTNSNSSIKGYSVNGEGNQVELKVKYVVGANDWEIDADSLLSFLLSEQPGVSNLLTHCKVIKKVKIGNDLKDTITYNLDSDIDEQALIQKLLKERTVTSIDTESED